jgi:cytochrome c oxidase accessory protein FixG
MTDQTQQPAAPEPEIKYFEKRRKIYPRAVEGIYRRRKWFIMTVCLLIYYMAPFIRWDRGPYAPDQAILLDMVNRRGYFFFIEMWPQEVYYLTGILVIAAVALFFATSLLGRVWCGYFCFQTVWTDLFIWVERLVQGDRAERQRLDASNWGWNKLWRKGLTHILWILIGMFTGGAFVLYFNDAPTLLMHIVQGEVSTTVLAFVFSLTFSTYLMAGFAREQVCTFMCPYARFQSAMFDEDSLIIAYDTVRGEPRGKHKKGDSWEGHGHCIDCTQCVQVCPMGIDIRDGLQIQCIACGLCIDACDSVMDKVGLPRGLVRYDTSRNMQAEAAHCGTGHAEAAVQDAKSQRFNFIRPRTVYYSLVLSIVSAILLYSLITRPELEAHVLHDRNPLYVTLSSGDVRNGYTLNVLNKTLAPRDYTLRLEGPKDVAFVVSATQEVAANALQAPADDVAHFRVFVRATADGPDREPLIFIISSNDGQSVAQVTDYFVRRGP